MSTPPVPLAGYRTICISAGSQPHRQTPLSEFQAVPAFVRSLDACLCVSLDDFPHMAIKAVGCVTLVEYPCTSLDALRLALESFLEPLKRVSYTRLFLCNFIHFRIPSRTERELAASALAVFTSLPPFYRRHVYDWGGYDYPTLLIRYDDRAKLPALNPLFIEKIMERNRAAFQAYTLDLTSPYPPPPFRKRKATRKRKPPLYYLRRYKLIFT